MKKNKLTKADLLEKIHANTTAKRWYIDYYLYNENEQLVRVREWVTMSKKKRQQHYHDLLNQIKKLISDGVKFGQDAGGAIDFDSLSLLDACRYLINDRMGAISSHGFTKIARYDAAKSQLSENSHRLYVRFTDWMVEWLTLQNTPNLLLRSFTRQKATLYFQWAKETKGYGANTLQTNKAFLRSVFNYFIDYHDLQTNNPLKVIKIRVPESDRHKPYTQSQLSAIKDYCLSNSCAGVEGERLWVYYMFIYYAFLRPRHELLYMRREQIGTDYIYTSSQTSKNNRSLPVRIVPELQVIIEEYKLRQGDPKEYVFSKGFKPGTCKPVLSPAITFMLRMRRKLMLDANCTIYSFKSTGAIDHYRKHNNLLELRNMMRHASLNTTAKYLRKYGTVVWGE